MMTTNIDLLYVTLVWMPAIFLALAGAGLLASESFSIRILSWLLPGIWVFVDTIALFWAHEIGIRETELADTLVMQLSGLMLVSFLFMGIMAVKGLIGMFSRPNYSG